MRDRVIHRFELAPLPHEEAVAYIDHRLRAAGWRGSKLFSAKALKLLIQASGGRARRINLLADKSLLAAYAQNAHCVDVQHVKVALAELQGDPVAAPTPSRWRALAWASGGLALGLGLAALAWGLRGERPQAQPQSGLPPPVALAAPAPMAAAASRPGLVLRSVKVTDDNNATKSTRIGYTIQLATLSNSTEADQYVNSVRRYVGNQPLFLEPNAQLGRGRVAVFLGKFESEAAARDAAARLPQDLLVNRPMVRALSALVTDEQP